MKQEEVTVQIKVKENEWMKDHYIINGMYAIHKSLCTVIPPVEQQEGEVCLNKSIESFRKYMEQFPDEEIKAELISKGYLPAPEHKLIAKQPIGVYEGQEIFEDEIYWYVGILDLKIYDTVGVALSAFPTETSTSSKVYLTPEEANARLKEEVEKKSKVIKFTFEDLYQFEVYSDENPFVSAKVFAIEIVEKEFNVIYITPNTESK